MLNKLGKYQLRRELGKGAMGIVYEGYDPFIERTVAIKTVQTALIPHDCLQETLERFRREAQAAGRLLHPNIIAIYEYGEDNGMAFIAMELVKGNELQERSEPANPQQIADCLNVMQQLLDALDYSHQNGVIHRDIKPANIMVTQSGQIKIADFGIAKIDAAGSDLTQLGTIVGTPMYMSPEQMEGQAVDRRSDLYSAGVMLYQLLTGARPFSGSSMTGIMHKVMHLVPPQSSSINSRVPPALDHVIIKAIAKDPAQRFQSAAEFKQALKAAMPSGVPTPALSKEDTVKLNKTGIAAPLTPVIEFDFHAARAGIDQRLAEERHNEVKQPEPASTTTRIVLNLPEESTSFSRSTRAEPPAPVVRPIAQRTEDISSQSSLLQSLAQEAASSLSDNHAQDQLSQAKAQQLHEAMSRLHSYLMKFSNHVNAMKPALARQYRLDARTQFNQLKWEKSFTDARREDLRDAARLSYVSFGITLCNTTDVMVVRPWNQLEALLRELQNLKLKVLNENDLNFRLARHESIQALLNPCLSVLIEFTANYDNNTIDVRSLNFGLFGNERFALAADSVTPVMLDELGLFLLARSNQLPAAFKRG
ncbi:MAG TPA: serine/threonine-protein kinase [Gallionellaceae bacterium]